MGGIVRLNHHSKRILQWRHKIPTYKVFNLLMNSFRGTKAVEDDPVTQDVELAVSQKALNPFACVPKPRPPMPSDAPVQRAEFVKNMQAYLASQGPR